MATSKTIQPTGETITIPEMTDRPDMSVVASDLSKITDAANALNSNKQNKLKTKYYNMPTAGDNVPFSSLDIPKGSFVSALVINANYVIAFPYIYARENNQYLGFIDLNNMGTRATGQYNIKVTYYD